MIYSLFLAKGGLFDPIAKPLAAVLAFFYSLIPNYGIAIVMLTIAMMIVLTPLTIKQTRSMLVMQKLQPEMKKLQEIHKNDRQALNEAVMALYKEHNASPLGGCLPMLLPFPLFIALLRVLEGLSHKAPDPITKVVVSMPKYLTAHTQMAKDIIKAGGELDAFGMNLAKSARNVGGGFVHSLPYFILLLIMVGTQFYQQYQLTSRNPAAKSQPGQAAMMKFIPLFFGLISLNFPAGVVLYWTVSNIIRIGQQWALYKYDPKVKSLVAKDVKEIEAKTREIEAKHATGPKTPGRSRFRDLLSNAADAAADRKNQGGKGAAQPGGKAPGDKGGAAGRGGRTAPGKPSGTTSGAPKSLRPGTTPGAKAAGAQKGVAPKPGITKGASSKATPLKPGAAKPGAPPKSGTAAKPGGAPPGGAKPGAGASKPGGARPGVPKPGVPKPGVPKPGAPKPAPSKASVPPKAAPSKAPAPKAPAAPAVPEGPEGQDAVPATTATNGATKAPTAPGANGSVNGGAANGAAKGRTGGGSARNVSSRRRRRGR